MVKFFLLFIPPLFYSQLVFAGIYKKGMGSTLAGKHIGASVEIDFNKSYFSGYFDFKNEKKNQEKIYTPNTGKLVEELYFYGNLAKKAFQPNYILMEMALYPLTTIGIFLKKDHRSFYDVFTSKSSENSMNLIEMMGTRFERPYSVSLFLGRIFPLFKDEVQSGSALMGQVLTISKHNHLRLVPYNNWWFQYSFKIKGANDTKVAKKKWTMELGLAFYESKRFIDAIIIRIDRNWASQMDESLLANLKIEYSCNIPIEHIESKKGLERLTTFQKFIVGRNYYWNKYVISLEGGFKWEVFKKDYTNKAASQLSFIVLPNISW